VPTPRQELILRKVVQGYLDSGQPVASKTLAADADLDCGPSTIRNELASLEEHGLLAHPHTSAGRIPTDAGYRFFVDNLLSEQRAGTAVATRPRLQLDLVRREVDEAMRATTEALSQVTNLLAVVTAPPIETAEIRHVEVLPLQPQVLMVVIITSTGGVSKRIFTFEEPVDPGLTAWASAYLNEQLVGLGLGARMLLKRLADPTLPPTERAFLDALAPAFTELADTAEDTLYVEGAARLIAEHRVQDLTQINELMTTLERRVGLLSVLRQALAARDIMVRIGAEHERPELRSFGLVASSYGLPARKLGTVSLMGPVRMNYGEAILAVREAAHQLSRYIETVYDDA
jgi:heat-inducible transcriptional repressor